MRLIVTFYLVIICTAAHGQQTPGERLAHKIAQKMKDTLSLSDLQRHQLYDFNMQLHNQKMLLRQIYASSDSLGIYMQRAESKRDSLYHLVLPNDKYLLYKLKKRNLVSNN